VSSRSLHFQPWSVSFTLMMRKCSRMPAGLSHICLMEQMIRFRQSLKLEFATVLWSFCCKSFPHLVGFVYSDVLTRISLCACYFSSLKQGIWSSLFIWLLTMLACLLFYYQVILHCARHGLDHNC